MTTDFFSDDEEEIRVPLRDAEVFYYPNFLPNARADLTLRQLIECTPWRSEDIVVWGKKFAQPRLIAWYGDEDNHYTYSGIKLTPLAWSPLLLELKSLVESKVGASFNSVLINYYRNHRDSMGFHSDDEAELGAQPVIASLSLGEQRSFILKHKTDKSIKPVCLKLSSGSLLVMKGDTQKYWRHGINKEANPCGPRVNLTFRRVKHA